MNSGLTSQQQGGTGIEKKTTTLFAPTHVKKDASVFSQCVNHGFSGRFLDTLV